MDMANLDNNLKYLVNFINNIFYSVIVGIQYYNSLKVYSKVIKELHIALINPVPLCSLHIYYSIIDHIPYATRSVSMTIW